MADLIIRNTFSAARMVPNLASQCDKCVHYEVHLPPVAAATLWDIEKRIGNFGIPRSPPGPARAGHHCAVNAAQVGPGGTV